MKVKLLEQIIEIPEGVTIKVDGSTVSASGTNGEVKKELYHPMVTIVVRDNTVVVSAKNATRREKMQTLSYVKHINNLIKGAQENFVYELKICSGHFPMSGAIKGSDFVLKNFLGEAYPRRLTLKSGAKVTVKDDIITVACADKELAGQISADFERLTRITNRDRRVFQDGIYITKKAGVDLS
ncbi:MAG: large subunit ribosomal protein L6 [Candidatus Woesearchaeota archaeon]|jgi:large subunit ribosomal protein L6